MVGKPQLLDHRGQPVKRAELTKEIAAPRMGGVRSPLTGYPADGLDPMRLAAILREADAGDPVRYLELAEIIEERDLHYLGVLGTRRRAVSQIPIDVKPASDAAADVELADMVREWIDRDELADELFDILDAIGKGYSFTEIVWEYSAGQYRPRKLIWRDPRWFRFMRHDLATPVQIDETGLEKDLPAFRFIFARMRAKSGLALRSGIARAALWGWMFKAYTQRDWAIFTQTYGQPLRVGKYGSGASEEDRDKLFTAVANIAGDCAAIIPDSMMIEFVETGNLSASVDHYEKRSDWLDRQVSKAVLGQTSTTDAEVGGLGSGKEHREVQEVIERADCRALQAIINRDLIVPWVQLERGPQPRYPKVVIGRPDEEDLKDLATALAPMIDRGLRVPAKSISEKFGLPEAGEEDEILRPATNSTRETPNGDGGGQENPAQSAVKHHLKGLQPELRGDGAEKSLNASTGLPAPPEEMTERLLQEAGPAMAGMLEQVEVMLEAAGSLEELREMLLSAFPDIDAASLAAGLGQALLAADLGGRAMLEDESGE